MPMHIPADRELYSNQIIELAIELSVCYQESNISIELHMHIEMKT